MHFKATKAEHSDPPKVRTTGDMTVISNHWVMTLLQHHWAMPKLSFIVISPLGDYPNQSFVQNMGFEIAQAAHGSPKHVIQGIQGIPKSPSSSFFLLLPPNITHLWIYFSTFLTIVWFQSLSPLDPHRFIDQNWGFPTPPGGGGFAHREATSVPLLRVHSMWACHHTWLCRTRSLLSNVKI